MPFEDEPPQEPRQGSAPVLDGGLPSWLPESGPGGTPMPEAAVAPAEPDRSPRARPPWSGWDVVLVVAVFLLSSLVAFAAAGVYAMQVHHETPEELAFDVGVMLPAQGAAYAVTFLFMYLLIARIHGYPFWQALGWRWPRRKSAVAALLIVGVPLAVAMTALESVLPAPSHPLPFEKLFTNAGAAYLVGGFAVLIAPFVEEGFFRGLLYPVLARWGTAWAVMLTALAFAGVHGSQYGWAWSAVLLMFLVGLVLTAARAVSGSVVPGFLIHTGYNLSLFLLMFFSTGHFRHLERM
jgi:hypothetical protein